MPHFNKCYTICVTKCKNVFKVKNLGKKYFYNDLRLIRESFSASIYRRNLTITVQRYTYKIKNNNNCKKYYYVCKYNVDGVKAKFIYAVKLIY